MNIYQNDGWLDVPKLVRIADSNHINFIFIVGARRTGKTYGIFKHFIDDVFTIMGVGTVATGNISTGMCREGENACVYKANGGVLETIIATVYKGNIIKNLIMDCQSYTKYRPNETTGGIFVSWRRKEELPTGA